MEEDPSAPSATRFRYCPKHESVGDRITLLNFIREHPSGTYKEELEDCYKGEEG